MQLVQPGEGTEDTRRIATRQEAGRRDWSLIQRLADRRLVVTGRDAAGNETAEVVHEALIQKWGRFQEWMDSRPGFPRLAGAPASKPTPVAGERAGRGRPAFRRAARGGAGLAGRAPP